LFTAIYFDVGFEDFEKYSPVDVVEAIQHSTENFPTDFIEVVTSFGRASISAASSPVT